MILGIDKVVLGGGQRIYLLLSKDGTFDLKRYILCLQKTCLLLSKDISFVLGFIDLSSKTADPWVKPPYGGRGISVVFAYICRVAVCRSVAHLLRWEERPGNIGHHTS